jgi:acetyl-CoA synthetase
MNSPPDLDALWPEETLVLPPPSLTRRANVPDRATLASFRAEDFPRPFAALADLLVWTTPWRTLFDDSRPPFWRWYEGGTLNATVNALDRHLPEARERIAYHWIPEEESEEVRSLTYGELLERVETLAAVLREDFGVAPGDRVTLHLPMNLDLPIAMLACARLGAIHSVVFSGFSARACADRILDSGSRLLLTADVYRRGGSVLDHKAKADATAALVEEGGGRLDAVLVFTRDPERYASPTPLRVGRDRLASPLLARRRGTRVAPVPRASNDGLFLMYSSGTTGKPKGCLHGHGGYLAWVAATSRWTLDLHPGDVYWAMADIGWITGHSYIVYGPLLSGVTSLLYEGVPHYPDPGRPWRIARRYGVRVFHTSPTALRTLRRLAPEGPGADRPPFEVLVTVGEPIEPHVWRWYYETVGGGRAAVVDTWWQTETGGHILATLPATDPMLPGSAGPPLPGLSVEVLDEEGHALPPGSTHAGTLVVRTPWPGLMLGLWGDDERYVHTYFGRFNRDPKTRDWRAWPYCPNDAARIDNRGYVRILGRIDDVINSSGHRLGSKEIESAALDVPWIAEAAVVPIPDPLRGQAIGLFVALGPEAPQDEEKVRTEVAARVVERIGPIARPQRIWIVPDMPKTRSGKIMRRILAALVAGHDPGDIATLANPEVVEALTAIVGASGLPAQSPG